LRMRLKHSDRRLMSSSALQRPTRSRGALDPRGLAPRPPPRQLMPDTTSPVRRAPTGEPEARGAPAP
jgi:hypothetical protein